MWTHCGIFVGNMWLTNEKICAACSPIHAQSVFCDSPSDLPNCDDVCYQSQTLALLNEERLWKPNKLQLKISTEQPMPHRKISWKPSWHEARALSYPSKKCLSWYRRKLCESHTQRMNCKSL